VEIFCNPTFSKLSLLFEKKENATKKGEPCSIKKSRQEKTTKARKSDAVRYWAYLISMPKADNIKLW